MRFFRNHLEKKICFDPGLNSLFGPNASGKTSILEAIHLLVTGRSHRSHSLNELAFYEEENRQFYVELHFKRLECAQSIRFKRFRGKNELFLNYSRLASPLSLLGNLTSVFLSPEDDRIVKGAPLLRRKFLDLFLAQQDPLYVRFLLRYTRALKQRNKLLKKRTLEGIHLWEKEMGQAASFITRARKKILSNLEENLRTVYKLLKIPSEHLSLQFVGKGVETPSPAHFLSLWKKSRPKDLSYRTTSLGPHRQDFTPLIGSYPLGQYGSEGQIRTFVYALRLAQWKTLYESTQEKPILLLDDFGFGLDQKRKNSILELLGECGQVIVTGTEPLDHASFSLSI